MVVGAMVDPNVLSRPVPIIMRDRYRSGRGSFWAVGWGWPRPFGVGRDGIHPSALGRDRARPQGVGRGGVYPSALGRDRARPI